VANEAFRIAVVERLSVLDFSVAGFLCVCE